MYEIIETANGWILRPGYRGGDGYVYFNNSEVYVFNNVKDLTDHLALTLKVLEPNQVLKG